MLTHHLLFLSGVRLARQTRPVIGQTLCLQTLPPSCHQGNGLIEEKKSSYLLHKATEDWRDFMNQKSR